MARMLRDVDAGQDYLLAAQRSQAVQAFLEKNPEVGKSLTNDHGDDLYTAVAFHISLNEEPGYRDNKTRELRAHLDDALKSSPLLAQQGPAVEQPGPRPADPMEPSLFQNAPAAAPGGPNADNRDIFSTPAYHQRALQAYDDLMEPIVRLAEEATKAVIKAEQTANNPNATDAQIHASFAAVHQYQDAIGRSLETIDQKLTSRLQGQFAHENIKVSDATVEKFSRQVVLNVKLPKQLESFEQANKRLAHVEDQYLIDRRELGSPNIERKHENDEALEIYDNSPRP